MKNISKSLWFFFDFFSISIFCISIVWASIDFNKVPIFTFIIFIFLGFALIYSKKLKEHSYFEKVLYWFSQNLMLPRIKYNHIIWGGFFLLIGLLSFLTPNNSEVGSNEALWKSLINTPFFWISLFIVIIFNLVVGIYLKGKGDGSN